ncbi:hypothetical protein PoB_003763000 [Plakobranchus ocellatus]|uniref:Uncharacterized protein n=1 Tax=Plakobranchus ocellatus TaxID=259542 RepID=A0AAV4AS41_9GAST|nr:hypothetical protein PoB_003763000 [Plakobranchus ocellatus]
MYTSAISSRRLRAIDNKQSGGSTRSDLYITHPLPRPFIHGLSSVSIIPSGDETDGDPIHTASSQHHQLPSTSSSLDERGLEAEAPMRHFLLPPPIRDGPGHEEDRRVPVMQKVPSLSDLSDNGLVAVRGATRHYGATRGAIWRANAGATRLASWIDGWKGCS